MGEEQTVANVGMDDLETFMKNSSASNIEYAKSEGINLPDALALIDKATGGVPTITENITTNISSILTALGNTGDSQQFNSGDTSQDYQKNWGSMNTNSIDIDTTIETLKGQRDTIGEAIAQYNRDLKELKKRSKLRALQKHVDSINGTEVDSWNDKMTITYTADGYQTGWLPSSERREGNYKIYASAKQISSSNDDFGGYKATYSIHYSKKVAIDYDSLIPSNVDTGGIFSGLMKWLDDDYEELFGKVAGVAESYPGHGIGYTNQIDDSEPIDEWCTYTPVQ